MGCWTQGHHHRCSSLGSERKHSVLAIVVVLADGDPARDMALPGEMISAVGHAGMPPSTCRLSMMDTATGHRKGRKGTPSIHQLQERMLKWRQQGEGEAAAVAAAIRIAAIPSVACRPAGMDPVGSHGGSHGAVKDAHSHNSRGHMASPPMANGVLMCQWFHRSLKTPKPFPAEHCADSSC